jgi:hypothetical protein
MWARLHRLDRHHKHNRYDDDHDERQHYVHHGDDRGAPAQQAQRGASRDAALSPAREWEEARLPLHFLVPLTQQ